VETRERGPENANHAARQREVANHQGEVVRRQRNVINHQLKVIELKAQMPSQHRQQFAEHAIARWAGQV